MPPHRPVLERLWERVVPAPNGCLIFTGATSNGYGRLSNRGTYPYAHRLVWEYEHGSIPSGCEIHHTCNTRRCVNVAHMTLLSEKQHGVTSANHRWKGGT